jgi:glycosyltransferase involved in cell wall biosynthesis
VKVAYIVSLFPKISETFILREMLALRRRGVEIVVVSLKSRREAIAHPEAEAFTSATIHPGPASASAGSLMARALRSPGSAAGALGRVAWGGARHPVLLAKSLPLVAVASKVAAELRRVGVDRVHAHWATYPALVAWAIRRFEGIPYSMTAHAHDVFMPNPLLREKIEESDFTVAISEFNRRFLEERCGRAASSKVRVIHCGVPLDQYPRRNGIAAAAGPSKIVSVGRMVDYKGFPTLLRAVASLRRGGRDVACDIVGDGPMEGEVRGLARSLGLEGSVRLLGARTQMEVKDLLRGATVCVLASERGAGGLMDGIPVVLMEAMALGVPAVGTRLSGVPEIIEDGRTGLMAEPGDAESIASAVGRLLDDPALAASLAAAGRRRIEESFDVDRSAAALHDLMISAGRRGGA